MRRARTAFCGPLEDDIGLFAAAMAGRALGRLSLHEAAAAAPLAEGFDASLPSLR